MNARIPPPEVSATGAVRAPLPGGRWHFQHGPIDLVLQAWGADEECTSAYERAWARFQTVLQELVSELRWLRRPVACSSPLLRGDHGEDLCPLNGTVARRMWYACRPFANVFITPMAAVAGAVADEILAAMLAGRRLARAYVNNGGDIAIHLAPGERFETGIVGDVSKPKLAARATIVGEDQARGIATSGWRGRSFSLGIADSVTVLAKNAATADAAATLIANAVNTEDPAVMRRPARELDPDSDLGDHLVTVEVGPLADAAVEAALTGGEHVAARFLAMGLIAGAYLELAECRRVVGGPGGVPAVSAEDLARSLRAQ